MILGDRKGASIRLQKEFAVSLRVRGYRVGSGKMVRRGERRKGLEGGG